MGKAAELPIGPLGEQRHAVPVQRGEAHRGLAQQPCSILVQPPTSRNRSLEESGVGGADVERVTPQLATPSREAEHVRRLDLRVAAVEVAELVRDYRADLVHREDLEQRQTEHQDAPRADAEQPAALRDGRVQALHDVDVRGRGLSRRAREFSKLREQHRRIGLV